MATALCIMDMGLCYMFWLSVRNAVFEPLVLLWKLFFKIVLGQGILKYQQGLSIHQNGFITSYTATPTLLSEIRTVGNLLPN